jgi:hypothetical protein
MIQTRQLRLTMTTAEHHSEPIVINLYVAQDSFNNRVQKFVLATNSCGKIESYLIRRSDMKRQF